MATYYLVVSLFFPIAFFILQPHETAFSIAIWAASVLIILMAIGLRTLLFKKERYPEYIVPIVPFIILCGLLCGYVPAIFLWSKSVPMQMVASAEAISLDKPYCLNSSNQVAKRKSDLEGLHARSEGNSVLGFHAELFVQNDDRIEAYFWSYSKNKFLPLSDYDFFDDVYRYPK